ncbi:MAG: hypothetical protein N2036_07435 [Bryobacteraceae bacterium]|nr:hypothetical protein [Bryobacteraceae bacterium]
MRSSRPAWRCRPRVSLSACLLLAAGLAGAQETAGQAEFAAQGFYLGGRGETRLSATGGVLSFQHLFPRFRLLGRLEDYRQGSNVFTGENFLAVEGLLWQGYRWNLRGGDFVVPLRPAGAAPANLWFPDLLVRGGRIDMAAGRWTATAFGGAVTVMQGPRMPYLRTVPQRVGGAVFAWKPAETVQGQLVVLHVGTDLERLAASPVFILPGRLFRSSSQALGNLHWKASPRLTLFAEAGFSHVHGARSPVSPGRLSATLSAEWEGTRFGLRANYVRQAASLLPLAGYFVGDRAGPQAEGRYLLSRRITLFGNAAATSSNLDRNPSLPSLRSTTLSAGGTTELPGRFLLMATLSSIRLRSAAAPSAPRETSSNRLAVVSLMRPVGRHSLRFGFRELLVRAPGGPGAIRSLEADDSFASRYFTLGGGLRFDTRTGQERRNSVLVRGNLNVRAGPLTAYASAEAGRDFANQTLFVVTQTRSTIAGISTRLPGRWNLSVEAVRNTILSELNPQNVFLLGNLGMPLWASLDAMNRWTLYFRLSRSVQWGRSLPRRQGQDLADSLYPVYGTVEAWVFEDSPEGPVPVAGIPVSLDGIRTEHTDAAGRARFTDVPQGSHSVALPPRQLPAEFDPSGPAEMVVHVAPRRASRVDFRLIRLGSFSGRFVSQAPIPFEAIIIRLNGTSRYTTPEEDGVFRFYNLPAGDYEIDIDLSALPKPCRLSTPARIPVRVRAGQEPPELVIGVEELPEVRPVREVQLNAGAPR